MTTTIPRSLAFDLAHLCAARVHANLISLHLAGLAGEKRSDMDQAYFAEVRAVISSIPDKWDRVDFAGHVRYLFHKLREEKGTEPTTRAYVASVNECRRLEKIAA